jgi:hypothetical protein
MNECPVLPPHGSADDYATAAFSMLQAPVTKNSNSHFGLILLKNSVVGHLGQI